MQLRSELNSRTATGGGNGLVYPIDLPKTGEGIKIRLAATRTDPTTAVRARGSKPFAGEAERSGKRGYCAAFNGALPVQQRLETLQKVYALVFAFSFSHIQRAALRQCSNDTKRFTRCARLHLLSAQRIYSAQRSTAQCCALRNGTVLAAVSPSQEKPSAAASGGTA